MKRELNPALTPAAYVGIRPDPFIAWLQANGLLRPGSCWTAEQTPAGHTYRRFVDFGKGWPANHIAGPLVVRPKRKLEMV